MIPFVFTGLSALLLQSAFMWPAQCAWMVFVFFIPLVYRVIYFPMRHSFLEGLWWGIVFFTGQFSAALFVLYEKAEGPFRLVAGLAFIVYGAVYAGLWFFLSSSIARGLLPVGRVLVWSVSTATYFYWVTHFLFWPCGQQVGYCFGSPLIPLAQYPWTLHYLGRLGDTVLTGLIIGAQALILLYLIHKKRRYVLMTFAFALPFVAGFFIVESEEPPEYLPLLCYVQPPAKSLSHPLERAEEINMRITKALAQKPTALCVLMPESSFTQCLNQMPEVVALWGANALAQNQILCIGSVRADTYNEYNTLYKIVNCRITNSYDKKNLMPFVEYLPAFGKKYEWIKNLFLKNQREFKPKESSCRKLRLLENLTVQPKLCSDIYMIPYGSDTLTTNHYPLLVAVNDSWFSCAYAQRLMYLYAVWYAMKHSVGILYIGHTHGCWISGTTGKTILL